MVRKGSYDRVVINDITEVLSAFKFLGDWFRGIDFCKITYTIRLGTRLDASGLMRIMFKSSSVSLGVKRKK